MIRRHLVSAAAVVTLAAGCGALAAAPAHASVSVIYCTGWQHATYDPGVTNTERLSTVTTDDYLNVLTSTALPGAA